MRGRLWWALLIQVAVGGVGLALIGSSGLLAGAPVAALLVPLGRRTWWAVLLGATILTVAAIGLSARISGHLNLTPVGVAGGLVTMVLVAGSSLLLAMAAARIRPALLLRVRRRPTAASGDPTWPKWDQPAAEWQDSGEIAKPQEESADHEEAPLPAPPERSADPSEEGGMD